MLDTKRIGANIASLAHYPLWEAIDKIHDLGFRSIELLGVEGSRHSIGLLPGVWLDLMSQGDIERLQHSISRFEHVSIHAPFVDAPLFTYNRRIAQEAFRQVKSCIEIAGRLGMGAVAVHANPRRFLEARAYWDDLVSVFRQFGDVAGEAGTVVGVETGYPNRYAEFLDLIRDIDHPAVGATVDIGHVAFLDESEPRCTDAGVANYNRNLVSLCHDLNERLVHMHIHDVRFADWRDHRTVGTGVIDLAALFRTLRQIDYAGLLQIELEEPDREAALLASKTMVESLIVGRATD